MSLVRKMARQDMVLARYHSGQAFDQSLLCAFLYLAMMQHQIGQKLPTVEFMASLLDEDIVLSNFICNALFMMVFISPKLLKKLVMLSSIGSGVIYLYPSATGSRTLSSTISLKPKK